MSRANIMIAGNAALILAASAAYAQSEGQMRPLRGAAYIQDSVSIFIDPETRCEYLVFWSKHSLARGSITPRLDRDGKPMCDAAKIGGAK